MEMKRAIEWMENSFDQIGGFLLVDRSGKIIHITSRYAEFLQTDQATACGRHITEIIPETRMMEVLHSGIPQIGDIWQVQNETAVVSRIPIIKNNRIVGAMAFSIFTRMEEAQEFARRVMGTSVQAGFSRAEMSKLWEAKYSFDSIIGHSQPIALAKRQAFDIAATTAPVLITGETGTGKELFAHAIHRESPLKNGPFIRVNCAAIPENLVESELFGYEDGAFTGAKKGGKPGKFEMAADGTIFLDEVTDLPLSTQAKLLRVLQEREIERLGGTSLIPVNARVISATNASVKELMTQYRFRRDLYYRVNAFTLEIPRLADCLADLPLLSNHFIRGFNREMETRISGLNDQAMKLLMNYSWPGNIRELKSCIERACLDAKMGLIRPENLRHLGVVLQPEEVPGGDLNLDFARERAEREAILRALEAAGGNKKRAARLLGINRTYLYRKLHELRIDLAER